MTRIIITFCTALAALTAWGQTLNICTGNITTAVAASSDVMTYSDNGNTLTVCGKAFNISDIDSIYIDGTSVDDYTVNISYIGNAANVIIAGNIAQYLTTTVNGANVTILQSNDLPDEITYTLQGSSDNGSFYMNGKLKASLVLNGLNLNSNDSAAINIRDGKRISVELTDGTVNTLSDAYNGSQKACFMVNGHTEFKGGGSLYLTGNTAHAFWGDEYVELKKSTGTIVVNSAVKDGFNINQYFEMKGGSVTVSGAGDDCIQVSMTDDEDDESNGQVIISDGTLDLTVTGTAAKGIKSEDAMYISGGTLTIKTSGGGEYDSSERDASACAAIKADGALEITGGTFNLTSSGAGGKGISGDGDVTISDGTINVTTTGKKYSYSTNYTSSPKGIKADANLTINGGTINVSTSGGDGAEGIESKSTLTINGGEVIVNAYDDAINASNNITINGGKVYAYASNNDGIDSNGTMTISGGIAIACGTTTPEAGFDCDSYTFAITGGVLIGLGGDTSNPTASATTQPVAIVNNKSYTSGKYLTLDDSNGNNILAFCVPRTYSSAALLISCPDMTVGSTYTLGSNATVTGGEDWQGYVTGGTVSSSGSTSSLTLTSTVTGSSTTSGGTTGGGTTNPGGSTGGGIGGGTTTPGGSTGGGTTPGGSIGGGNFGGGR
ncbi:MAG: carbohydrate-binding domain-containing protein [Prevotella sp.]|nr:carbohydrate-binding domain-containing protein [Prevotella sp.]